MIKVCLLSIALFLVLMAPVLGQKSNSIIKDLRYEWKIYDNTSEKFLPYLASQSANTIYFELDHSKYRSFRLQLKLGRDHFLYLNDKLVKYVKKPVFLIFDIDSLSQVYRGEELVFSIYSERLFPEDILTQIVNDLEPNRNISAKKNRKDSLKDKQINKDLFITFSILLFGGLVTFRTLNNRMFSEFFSIVKTLSLRQRFEIISAQSFLSTENLSFILLYSLLLGGSIMNILIFNQNISILHELAQFKLTAFWSGLFISLIAFVLLLLKRLLLHFLSILFRVRKIFDVHFYTYFRWSLLLSLVILLITVLNGILDGSLLRNYEILLIWTLCSLLCGRVALIFLVLNSQLSFHKLHIFVYLCSTEIIPLIIFLKFLIK